MGGTTTVTLMPRGAGLVFLEWYCRLGLVTEGSSQGMRKLCDFITFSELLCEADLLVSHASYHSWRVRDFPRSGTCDRVINVIISLAV